MAKSKSVAYLLWFFGGLFGLHHFYLGRDKHAFLWWAFIGGYGGLGWFRDLWRIPSYVEEANYSEEHVKKVTYAIKSEKSPDVSWVRFSGQMIVGNTFGYLIITAIPMEYMPIHIYEWFYILVPAACAYGVYFVGNVGMFEGSIRAPLIGAYLTLPLYYFYATGYMFWTNLLATYSFNWYSLKWRRKPKKKQRLHYRIIVLMLGAMLYILLWSSSLYFNTTITDSDGNEIKLRDAVKHFFKSPMWQEFSEVMIVLYNHIRYHGFSEIWKMIVNSFDPSGSQNAHKVLNLTGTESPEEITAKYRKLSRQWHPDKHKDPEMKKIAQDKFIEIQESYSILSKIKTQRKERNEEYRSTEL